ncbi:MAG TPA: hypothetical protein VHT75_13730 [Acidimicrobiales bacterium]|jgi:hypothetical protein|nr:hypothetical protein [Acidimicrobiales bacterium]
MSRAVDQFLDAIERATVDRVDVFAVDATVDATVPHWRFTVAGDEAIRAEFSTWYAARGAFDELIRLPLPDGELVSYTLSWEENGIPHACHQVHVLTVAGERILADRVWCGGRWPAQLLAEMEAAADA